MRNKMKYRTGRRGLRRAVRGMLMLLAVFLLHVRTAPAIVWGEDGDFVPTDSSGSMMTNGGGTDLVVSGEELKYIIDPYAVDIGAASFSTTNPLYKKGIGGRQQLGGSDDRYTVYYDHDFYGSGDATGEYNVSGSFTLKWEDVVSGANGRKYDLHLTVSDVCLFFNRTTYQNLYLNGSSTSSASPILLVFNPPAYTITLPDGTVQVRDLSTTAAQAQGLMANCGAGYGTRMRITLEVYDGDTPAPYGGVLCGVTDLDAAGYASLTDGLATGSRTCLMECYQEGIFLDENSGVIGDTVYTKGPVWTEVDPAWKTVSLIDPELLEQHTMDGALYACYVRQYNPAGGGTAYVTIPAKIDNDAATLSWYTGVTFLGASDGTSFVWTGGSCATKLFYFWEFPQASLQLTAEKYINDVLMSEPEACSFSLTGPGVEQIKSNDAEGRIVFDPVEYNYEDIGQTFTYVIREIPGEDIHTLYDPTEQTIEVRVDYEDGIMTAEAVWDSDGKFRNIRTRFLFSMDKESTLGRDLNDTEFRYALFADPECTDAAEDLAGNPLGSIQAGEEIDLDAGTYYVKETVPPSADYALDGTVHILEIEKDEAGSFRAAWDGETAELQEQRSGIGGTADSLITWSMNRLLTDPAVNDLIITKKVYGNMGDRHKAFDMTLDLFSGNGTGRPEGSWHWLRKDNAGQTLEEGEVTPANGTFAFALADGESLVIRDLTEGIRYRVSEEEYADEGYETACVDEEGVISAEPGKNAFVTVSNTRNAAVPTGAESGAVSLRAACILLACLGAAGAFLLRRVVKRRSSP